MAAVLLSTAGCTKFLTEDPKTFLTPDNYYVSEAQMQDAVNGLYPGIWGAYMAGIVAPKTASQGKIFLNFTGIFPFFL